MPDSVSDGGGPVYVHTARLGGELLETQREILSGAELDRAAAFRFDTDRNRYLESRIRLRMQLGHYAGMEPGALRLQIGPYGKPELLDSPWHFNLSHSAQFYAAAFSEGHPVGIDVETGRGRGELLDLVSYVCHPLELELLQGEPEEDARRRLFLCYWTAKEAFLKALGCGFQQEPKAVRIVGHPFDGGAVVEAEIPHARDRAWEVHFLEITRDRVLTVAATRGTSLEVGESLFDA